MSQNNFTLTPADEAKLAAAKEWFRQAGYGADVIRFS